MQTPITFRRDLVLRLLALAATAAVPATAMPLAGCGSCPETTPVDAKHCFDPAAVGTGEGGMGGAGGAGGAAGAGGGGAMMCPSRDVAATHFQQNVASGVWEILSDGVVENGECCYQTRYEQFGCIGGRPFLVGDELVVAPLVYGSREAFGDISSLPDVSLLSAEDRAKLALAWARDGQLEHASIASFGRFAMSLLAVGAPADLVEEAHKAALDEVRHARLCFGLASAYAGENIGPGVFPFDGNVEVTMSLEELAARTAQEGCIGETVAACVAAEQLAAATDPAVRAALEVIVADEARHAELAFRTVAWAIRVGGARVRAAVGRVFAEIAMPECPDEPCENAVLSAHGRLGKSAERAAMRRAMEDVVKPSAKRLLDCAATSVPHVAAPDIIEAFPS